MFIEIVVIAAAVGGGYALGWWHRGNAEDERNQRALEAYYDEEFAEPNDPNWEKHDPRGY
jgi:hypothetical protein